MITDTHSFITGEHFEYFFLSFVQWMKEHHNTQSKTHLLCYPAKFLLRWWTEDFVSFVRLRNYSPGTSISLCFGYASWYVCFIRACFFQRQARYGHSRLTKMLKIPFSIPAVVSEWYVFWLRQIQDFFSTDRLHLITVTHLSWWGFILSLWICLITLLPFYWHRN